MKKTILATMAALALCHLPLSAQSPAGMPDAIFPLGNKIEGGNFTGSAYVQQLVMADSTFGNQVGNVVFEPNARSKWHRHPGGQILLALAGVGYYHEKGKELQILRKGDVAKCPPDVERWHGATPDNGFTYLAITAPQPTKWLERVSDETCFSNKKNSVSGLSAEQQIIELSKQKWQWMADKNAQRAQANW